MASLSSGLRRAEMCYPNHTATVYEVHLGVAIRRWGEEWRHVRMGVFLILSPCAPRPCACACEIDAHAPTQDRRMSWKEFGDGVRGIAQGLHVVGMCRGQRLGVVARNSDVMLQYMYAAAYLGLVRCILVAISLCACMAWQCRCNCLTKSRGNTWRECECTGVCATQRAVVGTGTSARRRRQRGISFGL